jgi:hypothetical protein
MSGILSPRVEVEPNASDIVARSLRQRSTSFSWANDRQSVSISATIRLVAMENRQKKFEILQINRISNLNSLRSRTAGLCQCAEAE